MTVWSQVKVCGRQLSLRPIGCKHTLSVTQKSRCSCGMGLVALCKLVLSVFAFDKSPNDRVFVLFLRVILYRFLIFIIIYL